MKKELISVILITMAALSGCGEKAADAKAEENVIVSEVSVESTADSPATEKSTAAEKPKDSTKEEESKAAVTQEASDSAKNTDAYKTTAASDASEESKASQTPETKETPKSSGTAEAPKATTASTTTEELNRADTNTSADTSTSNIQTENNSNNNSSAATSTPAPEVHTSHTWNGGSVTREAACSSEGEKTYTCTVCGETRTESIARTSHNYTTETKAATCTEAGSTKTYCTICGGIQSESTSGSPIGHNFQKVYWPNEPTCQVDGDYNLICSNCGEVGGNGTDPALPHTPETKELCHGDCVNDTVTETTCSVCGAYLGRDAHNEPDDHDWVEGTYEEYDPETHSIVTKTSIYCNRCHAQQ